MASKYLTDSTGSYDLSAVVAMKPMTSRDRNGAVTSQPALLIFASGRKAMTLTDYKAAWQQWQAVVNPAPAAAAPAGQAAAATAEGSASPAAAASAAA